MKNPRYLLRLFLTFITRFKSILVGGAVIGIALFLILRFISPLLIQKRAEKIGVVGRYHTSDLPISILNLISDGLTKIDTNGQPQPALASEWKSTDDGKTWDFTLKDNLFWQDGTKITAGNIAYSFEDVEISYPDSKTIRFKLRDAFTPFPTVVSRPVFKKGLLGTGKWTVDKLSLVGSTVDQLTLHDKDGNRKLFKFYTTEERTKLAFKLGQVDALQDILDPVPLNNWNNTRSLQKVNEDSVIAVFFNFQDQYLGEKKLRQALSYAIDKKALSDFRALGPIPPHSWVYNSQIKPYDFDILHAKELVDEFKKDQGIKEGIIIKLVTTPSLLGVAEKIAQNWRDVGVETIVQVSLGFTEEFQAFLGIYDIPTDPDQYSTWHSTQTNTNVSHYVSQRVDILLEQGRQELDPEKRKKIYLDFQRFLLEDAPAAFLYYPNSYTITRK